MRSLHQLDLSPENADPIADLHQWFVVLSQRPSTAVVHVNRHFPARDVALVGLSAVNRAASGSYQHLPLVGEAFADLVHGHACRAAIGGGWNAAQRSPLILGDGLTDRLDSPATIAACGTDSRPRGA